MPANRNGRGPVRYAPVPSITNHILYDPIRECTICPLIDTCAAPVPPVGSIYATVMLIGEAPGLNEDDHGIPFTGTTWFELEKYMGIAGLARDDVWLTNTVKCKPPKDPELADAHPCVDIWLRGEIALVKPKVIIAMGQMATRLMLGDDHATMEDTHGYPVPLPDSWGLTDCWLIPVYHPSAGIHNTRLISSIRSDWEAVRDLLDDDNGSIRTKPVDEWAGKEIYVDLKGASSDAIDAVLQMALDSELPIAIDTEVVHNSVWCMSMAWEPGIAYIIDMADIHEIRWFFVHPTIEIIWHNGVYDIAKLLAAGIKLRPFRHHDTMLLARMLQMEFAGLKWLSSHLLGMVMEDYNDVVGVAQLPLAWDYLIKVYGLPLSSIKPVPVKELVWDNQIKSLVTKIKNPQPLSKKVAALLRDIKKSIDEGSDLPDYVKRWKDWGHETDQVVEVLGPFPIADLSHVNRTKAVWYSGRDADATVRLFPVLKKLAIAAGIWEAYLDIDAPTIPMIATMVANGMAVDVGRLKALTTEIELHKGELEIAAWTLAGTMFNLGSTDQLAYVLFDKLGLPHGRTTDTGKRATDDEVLKTIKHMHDIVPIILEWKEYDKVEDSYSVPLAELAMNDPYGRIHPDLTGMTVTTRLECRDPNLMAIPVRNEIGRKVREAFVPR